MEDSVSGSPVTSDEDESGPTVGGHMVLAVFSMLWSTVVMELWKRRSSTLSYRWGTLHLAERFAEPRPGFHGDLGVNPVTGRVEPLFPDWQRELRMALVSVPVVGLFLGTIKKNMKDAGTVFSVLPPSSCLLLCHVSFCRAGGSGYAGFLLGRGPGAAATHRLGLPAVSDSGLHAINTSHRLHKHASDRLQDGGTVAD